MNDQQAKGNTNLNTIIQNQTYILGVLVQSGKLEFWDEKITERYIITRK